MAGGEVIGILDRLIGPRFIPFEYGGDSPTMLGLVRYRRSMMIQADHLLDGALRR
jgi:hypothetical protein